MIKYNNVIIRGKKMLTQCPKCKSNDFEYTQWEEEPKTYQSTWMCLHCGYIHEDEWETEVEPK